MKNYLLIALVSAVFAVSSCCKPGNDVLVRFKNTTNLEITNAVHNFNDEHKTTIGDIPAGATTDYFAFDYFQIGDNMPMGMLNGNVKDGNFLAWSGMFCGTGVTFKQLEPGHYTLEIVESGENSNQFYLLRFEE